MTRVFGMTATLLLIGLCSTSFADEPFWTIKERTELSTAVFTGQVMSVERVDKFNEHADLHRASIAVKSVSKNSELVGNKTINVYFESPKDGIGKRCPMYVKLKKDDRATFFVRARTIDGVSKPFLEMGSDVQDDPTVSSLIGGTLRERDISATAIEAARTQGVASATNDIKDGNLRILEYGQPTNKREMIDRSTGYPVQVVAGCKVTSKFQAEADAYNRTMREWFEKQESAAASKKK